jgi:hypothetical protein
MRLNHVHLGASDVAALQGTLERHFGSEIDHPTHSERLDREQL